MNNSIPRYYTDSHLTSLETTVLSVEERDGKTVLLLADTIFHPQGGGQPTDTGFITGPRGCLQVERAKKREDSTIEHIGTWLNGSLEINDVVRCEIDADARQLYSRLHSAGHLIDVALEQLNIFWKPGKGYHFPDGPYVEHESSEAPAADLAAQLEQVTRTLIQQASPVEIHLDGALRTITLAGKVVPCGGTHVRNLSDIGSVRIRNIRYKGNVVRIGYNLE